jgi:hypothetical protein
MPLRAESAATQRPRRSAGRRGVSRSSSSDTFIECHTIQAATWPLGLPGNLLYAGILRERARANSSLISGFRAP